VVVEHLKDDYFEDTPLLWKLGRKVSLLNLSYCQRMKTVLCMHM